MANVKPIPEGYHSVTPYLSVNGAVEAIEYYKKAFGAVELFRMEHEGKIGHAENHAIPPTWLLRLPTSYRTRSRCPGAAEQQRELSERDAGECGELLAFQLETESVRVERHRPRDVFHLVSDTMHADDAVGPGTVHDDLRKGQAADAQPGNEAVSVNDPAMEAFEHILNEQFPVGLMRDGGKVYLRPHMTAQLFKDFGMRPQLLQ